MTFNIIPTIAPSTNEATPNDMGNYKIYLIIHEEVSLYLQQSNAQSNHINIHEV